MDYKQIDIREYQGFFDIPYSRVSNTCKLDIILPEGKGPFPIIVSIHGGAFKKCDKRDEFMIHDMLYGLDKGYAVIGVNYRLSGEATFPKPVKDIKQAIRFIKDNAEHYNLDKEKIVVWGGSAGGYMSLMAGLIDKVELFDGDESYSDAKVHGVVSQFPPVDFTKMDVYLKESGFLKEDLDHNLETSPEALFMGGAIIGNEDQVRLANPETYINIEMCPMFIQHGRMDVIVPYQGSSNFAKLSNILCDDQRVIYEIVENAGHGDKKFSRKENLEKIYEFINKVLK